MSMKISIDEGKCIGCGTCEVLCANCFKMDGNIARVIDESCDECESKEVVDSCPVSAIIISD